MFLQATTTIINNKVTEKQVFSLWDVLFSGGIIGNTIMIAIFLLGIFLTPLRLKAQISIAPTTVFIDQNGIGTIFITNPGETPQEINVSFLFGYPGNDDLGNR